MSNSSVKEFEANKLISQYCCPKCGLIFLAEDATCNDITCPECGNYKKDIGVIPVDSLIYAFSRDEIEENLKKLGKKIHYAKSNPLVHSK